MRKTWTSILLAIAFLCCAAWGQPARSAHVRVFCSNPVEGPVAGLAEAFGRETGHRTGKDYGISTLTIIMADEGKSVRLAGPLPAELQNYEPYLAAVTGGAKSPDAARAFIAFLTSPQAKATLAKRGVEQAR